MIGHLVTQLYVQWYLVYRIWHQVLSSCSQIDLCHLCIRATLVSCIPWRWPSVSYSVRTADLQSSIPASSNHTATTVTHWYHCHTLIPSSHTNIITHWYHCHTLIPLSHIDTTVIHWYHCHTEYCYTHHHSTQYHLHGTITVLSLKHRCTVSQYHIAIPYRRIVSLYCIAVAYHSIISLYCITALYHCIISPYRIINTYIVHIKIIQV